MASDATNETGLKKSKSSVTILSLPWAANDSALVWQLIGEIEVPENFKVLFGKKSKFEE